MSTAYAGSALTWEHLLDLWRDLEVPAGWRPALAPEAIDMAPPTDPERARLADLLHAALVSSIPPGCALTRERSVGVQASGDIWLPDVLVAPAAELPSGPDPLPAARAALVVGIPGAGRRERDRRHERACALGGVPRYLLVDRFADDGPAVSLFTEPLSGVYSRILRVPFGVPLDIGEPFDLRFEVG